MTTHPKPSAIDEQVACEICLQEVPLSEANTFEAEEYVAHFCGLECYATWKARSKGTPDKTGQ